MHSLFPDSIDFYEFFLYDKRIPTNSNVTTIRQLLREELQPIKEKLEYLTIKLDTLDENARETNRLMLNLYDWSEDIHGILVKNKLLDRIKRLEQIVNPS